MSRILALGQWQQWLNDNFQLSQQTATNFMNVANRFGKIQIDLDFKPTQMIALLSLSDAEETEKFIEAKAAEGKKVADMTIKQLREEIAEQVVSFIRRLMTSGHDDGVGVLVTNSKRYRKRRMALGRAKGVTTTDTP